MERNESEVEVEIIEIEKFAREGTSVPKNKQYKIRVDKETFVVDKATITGREILDLVHKSPDAYNLYEHFHRGQTELIKPDQVVDLTAPGVERFTTMKVENKEGA